MAAASRSRPLPHSASHLQYVATARHRRRQRSLGDVVRSTATLDGEAPLSIYDRAPWWVQHAVLLRIAVVLLILALALGAIAVLVWGMKQTYW
jgi:hypothetical protein